jgi:hypothetical protein
MSRRAKALLLVALVAVLVNLPLVHSTWTAWRVDRTGTDVVGTVTDTSETSDAFQVEFRMPRDIDPDQRLWKAQVDEATYDEAVASEQVDVRVLPDRPSAYLVEGEVTSRLVLVVTGLVDLLLLLALVLVWRGSGRRADLLLRATEDVRRCRPGAVLEAVDGGLHLVAGEVCVIEPGEIVLDLGDRRVRVQLAGYNNPVGYQQPAQVTGRLVG